MPTRFLRAAEPTYFSSVLFPSLMLRPRTGHKLIWCRYAYTEQLSTNEDDFEGIELDATDSAPAFSIDDEDENELADDNLESIATLDSEFTSPTSLKKTAEDDI